MKEEATGDEITPELREAFAKQIRVDVASLPTHIALQIADKLCAVQLELLAGIRVSYRAREAVDAEAIAEDWRKGLDIREITAKHGISRSAAYKHHPSKAQRTRGTAQRMEK